MSNDARGAIDATVRGEQSKEWTPPPGHPTGGAYARIGKNVVDITLGLTLLVLTLPVQLAMALLSAATLRRRPVEKLPRIGKAGEQFVMFRFATARGHGARGARSRIGEFARRYGLDELPQLWNVLMGQMSLVGPRPLPLGGNGTQPSWEQQRRLVRPGITGLAQLEARSRASSATSTGHFDIQYVDQVSLRMDLRIIASTVPALLRREPMSERGRNERPAVHIKLMFADILLWLAAVGFSAWAHFDFDWARVEVVGVALSALLAVATHLIWAKRQGLYVGRWQLTSMEGMSSSIAGAALVTVAVSMAGIPINALLSPSVLLPGGAIFVAGAIATRLTAAAVHDRRQRSPENKTSRLLVFGAGEAGTNAAKAIWADPDTTLAPVAFLDDNHRRRHGSVLGLPIVGGRHDIAEAARRYDADSVLVAIPSAHPKEVNEVAFLAQAAGLDVQVLPPLAQWLSALLVERTDRLVPSLSANRPNSPVSRRHVQSAKPLQIFDMAVVGLGYVGLPLAFAASKVGLRVCGLDVDAGRVDALNRGASYIDDITAEDVQHAISSGFVAQTDPAILALTDTVTISVPTPLKDGLPDLGAVVSASEAIGDHLLPGQLVVLESTTYPGTTEEVVLPILESRSGLRAGIDFHLAYSPERIDPGNPEYGIHNTPKLIAGIDQTSTERAAALYGKFCPTVEMTGTKEAEMAKLLENTYRQVNIALVNELAVFCNELGVDIWETIRGASTKPFGFQTFYPGPGVGGHCIPIDPNYLSYRVRQLGKQFRFIELAQEINEFMPRYVAERSMRILERHGKAVEGARVLILGVTYKPDIGDVRETTATAVVRHLRAAGASVEYVDPHVESFAVDGMPVPRRNDPSTAVAEADLTLVHTPHTDMRVSDLVESARSVFDLRGAIPGREHERI